jgi:tetratricopeptide (TPR) repeat protein
VEQEIIMLHNCGDNYLALDRERDALYFYSESLRRSKAARYDRLTEANEMFVGFLEVTSLGVEAGLNRLRAAIASAQRTGRLWNLTQGHRLLGQALLFMGNIESSVYHLREALRLAQETGVAFFIEQAACQLERAQRAAGAIS